MTKRVDFIQQFLVLHVHLLIERRRYLVAWHYKRPTNGPDFFNLLYKTPRLIVGVKKIGDSQYERRKNYQKVPKQKTL